MNPLASELEAAARTWEDSGWPRPKVIVVTGSGLDLELGPRTHGPVPLTDLVPFSIHAVEGHALEAEVIWPREDRPTVHLRGRLHCYQGFDAHQVVFPVRLAALLGAQVLLLTNAAGSLRPEHGPGSLCLVADHLNLSGQTPLRGLLPATWGERFPAMNDAYDGRLRELGHGCARRLQIPLVEATYAWLLGPSYETPAEIRMLRHLGADLVGMSTVPEVLAARQLGVRCLALSLITNLAAGLTLTPPSHQEVVNESQQGARSIGRLLADILRQSALLDEAPDEPQEDVSS